MVKSVFLAWIQLSDFDLKTIATEHVEYDVNIKVVAWLVIATNVARLKSQK